MFKRILMFTIVASLALIWMFALVGFAGEDHSKHEAMTTKAATTPKAATIEDCLAHKAVAKFYNSVSSAGVNSANVTLTQGVELIASTDDPAKVAKLHKAFEARQAEYAAIKNPETELCSPCQDFMAKVKEGKINWEFAKFNRGVFELFTSQDPALAKHLQEEYSPKEKKG